MQDNPMDTAWFKLQLKRAKKTQRGLACALGRDPSVVSKILAGRVPVSLESLGTIANYLEVPPLEVLAHLGLPELLEDRDLYDRDRLVYAAGGVLEYNKNEKVPLDLDDISETIADFYQYLGTIDQNQWKPAINTGMGHRVRQAIIQKNKQKRRN